MRLIDADELKARYGEPCHSFLDVIDDMPTIEAEPVRHGRWMDKSMDYYCSACGTQFHDDMFWIQGDCITPNYCPNCGAKMDGKEADHGL